MARIAARKKPESIIRFGSHKGAYSIPVATLLERRGFTNGTSILEERPSVIERAFQIAKSGTVTTIAELSAQLTAEGYPNAKQLLAGRSLALQVTRMIADSRSLQAR